MLRFSLFFLFALALPLQGGEQIDKSKVLEAVDQLSERYDALADEIDNLKKLLGVYPALDGLQPLAAEKGMNERLRIRIGDGVKSYKMSDYERAKEDFQRAWKKIPIM